LAPELLSKGGRKVMEFRSRITKIIYIGKWFNSYKIPFVSKLIKAFMRIIFSCDIPIEADIHRTVHFPHNALGVVIHRGCRIGEGSVVYQNVTLGVNLNVDYDNMAPKIGANVIICAGAKVIGKITIEDNCIIGSGAVVTKSIPANSVVGGVPAKVLRTIEWSDI
jgi:serine O-acetyltransferase